MVTMSRREIRRYEVISKAEEGYLTVGEAAEMLSLSERQVKRLKKGAKQKGTEAFIHGNRGRRPATSIKDTIREEVIKRALLPEYAGVNDSHFRDLLEERERIVLSRSSVRRIRRAAGILSSRKHRRAKRHLSRPRKAQAGLLVQVDGSPHDWLEGRGRSMCLVAIIDDASSKVLGATFRQEEDSDGYFTVLEQMAARYGLPLAIYSDRHTIFVSPKSGRLSIEDELAGKTVPLTQVGRALEELGISHCKALSPQAKGRIERLWGTFQDRLVIEMRLAGVKTLEEANTFLPDYVEKHNKQFSVAPQELETAFRKAPAKKVLMQILCRHKKRQASNGSTISYEGRTYQLVDTSKTVVPLVPKAQVTLLLHRDGPIRACYLDKVHELQSLEVKKPEKQATHDFQLTPRKAHKPAADHPWRRTQINPKKREQIPQLTSALS
jgi:transposase